MFSVILGDTKRKTVLSNAIFYENFFAAKQNASAAVATEALFFYSFASTRRMLSMTMVSTGEDSSGL